MLRGVGKSLGHLVGLLKFCFLFFFALFLPRIFLEDGKAPLPEQVKSQEKSFLVAAVPVNNNKNFVTLLSEVDPLDVGVGSQDAFQYIALSDDLNFPRHKWYELRAELKKCGIESKLYRHFNQRTYNYCTGLKLQVCENDHVASANAMLAVLSFFKQAGVTLSFSQRFDAVVGTHKVREFFQGTQEMEEMSNDVRTFFSEACVVDEKALPNDIHV